MLVDGVAPILVLPVLLLVLIVEKDSKFVAHLVAEAEQRILILIASQVLGLWQRLGLVVGSARSWQSRGEGGPLGLLGRRVGRLVVDDEFVLDDGILGATPGYQTVEPIVWQRFLASLQSAILLLWLSALVIV